MIALSPRVRITYSVLSLTVLVNNDSIIVHRQRGNKNISVISGNFSLNLIVSYLKRIQ